MTLTIHPKAKDILMAFGGSTKDSEYIREQIRQAGCWAFIEDQKIIHLYMNRKATERDLVELFAHELSHAGMSELRTEYNEEDFCTRNAALCLRAYDLAKRVRP